MALKRIIHTGKSQYQDVQIVETVPYGTMLLLDGKMQSSEADEWAYHETLVHIAMLQHPNPKSVFIMGGGEGATAREVLRHKSVEKVVMVDIDEVVCKMCGDHIPENGRAFRDPRLTLVHDDAGPQLENWPGTFDVIISDLADPVYGGPCYHLYTQEFYQSVVRAKLNPGGIFIAQAGPAGMLSHDEVFTSIYKTISSVFPTVLPYHAHFPSFCDEWGFHLALPEKNQASPLFPPYFLLFFCPLCCYEKLLPWQHNQRLSPFTPVGKSLHMLPRETTVYYSPKDYSNLLVSGVSEHGDRHTHFLILPSFPPFISRLSSSLPSPLTSTFTTLT